MATLLQFVKPSTSEKRVFAADHTATILIYNGVRFERLEADEANTPEHQPKALPGPARRAN
jgi:hypothetical protein